MAINCLRCKCELKTYRFIDLELPHEGQLGVVMASKNALVSCRECGHYELFHIDSVVLKGLTRVPTKPKES